MTRPVASTSAAIQSADAAIQWERDIANVLRINLAQNEQLIVMLSRVIVDGLRSTLGGQELRIPAPDIAARNAEIRAKYTGANVHELASEYDLCVRMIYYIVQKV